MIFNYTINPATQQLNAGQLSLALADASTDFISMDTAGNAITIRLVDESEFDPSATIITHCAIDWRLAELLNDKIDELYRAYATAITQDVSFQTASNTSQTFQADVASQQDLANIILAFGKDAATPAGFYWVAADNTQVPFTYADLQGLAATMGAQGWNAFQHLQAQKAAVRAATTAESLVAITW